MNDSYKHDLQFYTVDISHTEMNYENLKKIGVLRLSILKNVQKLSWKHEKMTGKKCLEELIDNLRDIDTEFADFLKSPNNCDNNANDDRLKNRFLDHVSHNVLALSLAQTARTSKWLQETEAELFRWRLEGFDEKMILDLMRIQNIRYPVVPENEKISLKDHLCAMSRIDPEDFDDTIFYKVPWIEGTSEIVTKYQAVLISGKAYITAAQLRPVIVYHFRCHMKNQLTIFQSNYGRSPDPRVYELINYIQKIEPTIGSTLQTWTPEAANIEDLDMLAVNSFPPCMRKLHEALNRKLHLRHDGRLHYTFFLKSIGIDSQDAIDYFRDLFTERMTGQEFDKRYDYGFRHMYGLVGSKKDYHMYGCKKIGRTYATKNTDHGCPFTLHDIEDLDRLLNGWNTPTTSIQRIRELVEEKKYGKACEAYFEGTQSSCVNYTIKCPTDYYNQSRELVDSEGSVNTQMNELSTDTED